MRRRSGIEEIRDLKRILGLMHKTEQQLETTTDVSSRVVLNQRQEENPQRFTKTSMRIVRMMDGDPHAFDLVNRVEDDPNFNMERLSKNLVSAAPVWEAHIDAALAADEFGPIGDDFEDDDT